MKIKSIFFLFSITLNFGFRTLNSFAQGEANFWYFGYNAGLDFNGGTPVAVTNGQLNSREGGTSISDAAGNLLFYTDGITVWNKNHVQMPNGFGLMGNTSSTQSALITQKPCSANIYYIFTVEAQTRANGIRYTEVDMSLNAGMGDVTANKNILLNTPSCEKITGIRHCNNQDVWVVTHDWNSDAFRTYLVTSAGVNIIAVISNAGTMVNGNITNAIGQLKGSHDGKKLASAIYYDDRFELFDFNNLTGIVSNAILFPPFAAKYSPYGVEFSPDGTKMYGSYMSGSIYQFDLLAGSNAAIANSGVLIGTSSNGGTGSLQLGPDKKIYLAREVVGFVGYPWLGVINSPNILGAGCNYVDNGVSLATKNSALGLPNFVSYYFKQAPPPPFTVSVNCLTGTFTAPTVNIINCSGSGNAITSVSWNFGDPTSGANNTSIINNPTHTFTSAGTYTVTLVLNYACGNDTITQNVTVLSCGFTATTNQTNVSCNGQCLGTAIANPSGGTSPYTYSWNTLPVQTTQTATGLCAGTYTVTVISADSLNTTTTATVTITQPTAILLSASSTTTACTASAGTATANPSGGTPGYAYLWSTSPAQTTITATGLGAGTYTVTVTDLNGCTQTQTVTVTSNTTLTLNTASTQTGCTINNGTASATPANGTAPYTYLWNNGQTTSAATELSVGTYTITVTDASGCTQTQTMSVTQIPGPTVTVTAAPTSITPGASTTLTATGGGTYQWFPAAGLNCVTCANPVVTASPLFGVGGHIYCVTITDNNNCKDSACVTVTVIAEPTDCSPSVTGELYLPNAFSPNGDNENDVIKIYYGNYACIKTFKLVIYNRWGEKVFKTDDSHFQWDGASGSASLTTGKGKIMNTGVFVYYLEITLISGEEIIRKGNVSLIK